MMENTTIIIIAVILILIYIYSMRRFRVFSKMGIPGPRPWPFIGNLVSFSRIGIMDYDFTLSKTYGKIFGTYLGPAAFLTIGDVSLLKDVMIKQHNSFVDHFPFLRRPFPMRKNLVDLKGDDWRRVRQAISPIFTSGKLKRMTSMIDKNTQLLISKFIDAAESSKEIDAKDFFGRYTIAVISDTMFGMEIESMNRDDDPFYVNAKKVMNFSGTTFAKFIMVLIPEFTRLFEHFEMDIIDIPAATFFTKAVERAIEERKGREEEFHDFLSLMLKSEITEDLADQTKVRGLDLEEILSQSLVFMLAGYDTTSNALSYTAFLLTRHPEHQERCRDEILAEFCEDSPEEMYESLSRLTYLDQCLKETLRLYSPAPRTDRVATEDVTLGDYKIPKGMGIAIPIKMLLHDPELWNEPEQFNPDRFAPDGENEKNKLPFHYLVFGGGPRNCIGMRFALLEAKLALAKVLKTMRLVPCEKTPEEPLSFTALGQLKQPIFIKAERL